MSGAFALPSRATEHSVPNLARRLALVVLTGFSACAGGSVQWPGAQTQDPAPTGPRYLREYKESHFRALGNDFRRALTDEEFHARLHSARVMFLGDHHADASLHARMVALLDRLHRHGRSFHLGLECIGTQDDSAVHQYLSGTLSYDDLVHLLQARWPDTWLTRTDVDGPFYATLLQRAKQHGLPVFALEPTPRLPLYERDQAIARNVLQRARDHADALLVLVVGETHLLGFGQLAQRIDLPHVALCASLSVQLRQRLTRLRLTPEHRFLETTTGVLFALPIDANADD